MRKSGIGLATASAAALLLQGSLAAKAADVKSKKKSDEATYQMFRPDGTPVRGKRRGIGTNQESFKAAEDNYTLGRQRERLRQKRR